MASVEAAPRLRPTAVDPLADERWRRLIDRSPDAGPFHHPLWLGLLGAQYGYDLHAACVAGPDGELVAGLPYARVASRITGTRLVALPFSDLCEPVVRDRHDAGTAEALAAAIDAERRRHGLELEIRANVGGMPGAMPGQPFLHHALATSEGIAAVEARFSKSQVKRGIRKARREGVAIDFGTDRAALDDFFGLHVRTRQRQGVPTQPKRFIRGFEPLFAKGLGWVCRARFQSRTIAAAVFLSFNGTVIYKYGASDRDHLDKRPNNLLFVEAIARACAEGAHTFDFGRTDLDNPGLAAFKRSWGAIEREVRYHRFGGDPRGTDAEGGGVPAPVQKLIQRGPPAFGRWLGAAMYRHFG